MQMVIPCGGLATRLGSLAKKTPKSLVEIDGRPFLEYQIDLLKKYDFDELLLLIGHMGEKIESYFQNGEKFGIKISYSYDKQMGVIGALKNAEKKLKKTFFMMYGDSYLPNFDFMDMYEKYKQVDEMVMMAVWKNKDNIDPSNIKVRNKKVVSAGEKDSEYIDYGVIIFDKRALDYLPENRKISTEQCWQILSDKKEIASYKVDERYYEIGRPDRLEEVRKLLQKKNR